jgi:hypothetical protein
MNNRLYSYCLINLAGLALSVSFGVFTLYVHNNVLPYLYALLAVFTLVIHMRFYCTRCLYYGKDCYILGGHFSKLFYKPRHNGPADPDDAMVASLWVILALFPVPFLLYYQDIVLALVYTAFFWGWFMIHKQTACEICGNKWCGLYKNKK